MPIVVTIRIQIIVVTAISEKQALLKLVKHLLDMVLMKASQQPIMALLRKGVGRACLASAPAVPKGSWFDE
jgi:hypothetical protein